MMSTDDAVPRKGVTRANQMRTTKTEAALFFIECLNDLSCLFKFMDVLQIDDVMSLSLIGWWMRLLSCRIARLFLMGRLIVIVLSLC